MPNQIGDDPPLLSSLFEVQNGFQYCIEQFIEEVQRTVENPENTIAFATICEDQIKPGINTGAFWLLTPAGKIAQLLMDRLYK